MGVGGDNITVLTYPEVSKRSVTRGETMWGLGTTELILLAPVVGVAIAVPVAIVVGVRRIREVKAKERDPNTKADDKFRAVQYDYLESHEIVGEMDESPLDDDPVAGAMYINRRIAEVGDDPKEVVDLIHEYLGRPPIVSGVIPHKSDQRNVPPPPPQVSQQPRSQVPPPPPRDQEANTTVECSSCRAILIIPHRYAGTTGTCQHCGAHLTVPAQSPT
jgi:hypothetical protein